MPARVPAKAEVFFPLSLGAFGIAFGVGVARWITLDASGEAPGPSYGIVLAGCVVAFAAMANLAYGGRASAARHKRQLERDRRRRVVVLRPVGALRLSDDQSASVRHAGRSAYLIADGVGLELQAKDQVEGTICTSLPWSDIAGLEVRARRNLDSTRRAVIRIRRYQPRTALEFRPAIGPWWRLREATVRQVQTEVDALTSMRPAPSTAST